MGKMADGFRNLGELDAWDLTKQKWMTYYGLDYVWVLVKVNDSYILPARCFTSTKKLTIPDIFGADREYRITGWRPMPGLVPDIDRGRIN